MTMFCEYKVCLWYCHAHLNLQILTYMERKDSV